MIATATFSAAEAATVLGIGLAVGVVLGAVGCYLLVRDGCDRKVRAERARVDLAVARMVSGPSNYVLEIAAALEADDGAAARRVSAIFARELASDPATYCHVHEAGACPDGCPHAYAGEPVDPPYSAAGGSFGVPLTTTV